MNAFKGGFGALFCSSPIVQPLDHRSSPKSREMQGLMAEMRLDAPGRGRVGNTRDNAKGKSSWEASPLRAVKREVGLGRRSREGSPETPSHSLIAGASIERAGVTRNDGMGNGARLGEGEGSPTTRGAAAETLSAQVGNSFSRDSAGTSAVETEGVHLRAGRKDTDKDRAGTRPQSRSSSDSTRSSRSPCDMDRSDADHSAADQSGVEHSESERSDAEPSEAGRLDVDRSASHESAHAPEEADSALPEAESATVQVWP
ncbi:hypothetical protein T484DRAFT_1826504 [Baffinella frigidus]|nr:hypothetical protein T484DRAFT_1826504 [Cryptophyta sp. CCMP2293]